MESVAPVRVVASLIVVLSVAAELPSAADKRAQDITYHAVETAR
jgi:hypothetical protein